MTDPTQDAPEPPVDSKEPPPPPDREAPRWRRPEMRRRVALLVLVVGIAGLVAYWSRNRPVEVAVIFDFGRDAPRVTRLQLAFSQKGQEDHPVEIDFPERAPKRYRHTLRLTPGTYTVRARVHLRGVGDRADEVKRHTRRVTIEGSQDQRLTLRLGR